MNTKIATTLALSAAALFLGGCAKDAPATTTPDPGAAPAADAAAPGDAPASADAAAAGGDPARQVRCYGVNECSGQTACDVAGKWDCAGNNDCKGKGWLKISKADCDTKGGSEDVNTVL
jgi:hypothetical protein